MAVCLTISDKTGRVSSHLLAKDEASVGRSSSNDLRIESEAHAMVSRRHGIFRPGENDTYVYEDLNSTHGSFFNGQEIKGTTVLDRADAIQLGRDGPMASVFWPMERLTGREGTHIRLHRKGANHFPLVFSPGFLERYGRYDKIAAGGFGEVWQAYPHDGSPSVAIKLMHPMLLDPENIGTLDRASLVARFTREAQLTHMLSQSGAPSIVKVHSWGDDPERDYLFIVMEMVQGISLDRLIFKEPIMSERDVTWYMLQIAQGLDAAHNFTFADQNGRVCRGIVHRDIKPNNLLIEVNSRRACIVDFGIAGIQEGGDRLTATNITVGTHQFLPLESIEKNVISPQTDLWGFTVTLYLALSRGRFPYTGRLAGEITRALRNGDMMPITAYRQDLSPVLVDAIARSLQPQPEKRVQTAGEWVEILRPLAGAALETA